MNCEGGYRAQEHYMRHDRTSFCETPRVPVLGPARPIRGYAFRIRMTIPFMQSGLNAVSEVLAQGETLSPGPKVDGERKPGN